MSFVFGSALWTSGGSTLYERWLPPLGTTSSRSFPTNNILISTARLGEVISASIQLAALDTTLNRRLFETTLLARRQENAYLFITAEQLEDLGCICATMFLFTSSETLSTMEYLTLAERNVARACTRLSAFHLRKHKESYNAILSQSKKSDEELRDGSRFDSKLVLSSASRHEPVPLHQLIETTKRSPNPEMSSSASVHNMMNLDEVLRASIGTLFARTWVRNYSMACGASSSSSNSQQSDRHRRLLESMAVFSIPPGDANRQNNIEIMIKELVVQKWFVSEVDLAAISREIADHLLLNRKTSEGKGNKAAKKNAGGHAAECCILSCSDGVDVTLHTALVGGDQAESIVQICAFVNEEAIRDPEAARFSRRLTAVHWITSRDLLEALDSSSGAAAGEDEGLAQFVQGALSWSGILEESVFKTQCPSVSPSSSSQPPEQEHATAAAEKASLPSNPLAREHI